jgi:adhesin/invasin
MRISANPSNLLASKDAISEIEVILYSAETGNPIVGKPVNFFATPVTIITRSDTTDEQGIAHAIARSDQKNTEIRVYAWARVQDSLITVSTTITISGVNLSITRGHKDVLINTSVPVIISVTDGKNQPIPDATVSLSVNGSASTITTAGDGTCHTTVSRSTQGIVAISASANGASSIDTVWFWDALPTNRPDTISSIRKLQIHSTRSQLRADYSDYAIIVATLIDENNAPAVGDTIFFWTTLGIVDRMAVVDSSGNATAVLRSTPVNGLCQVGAVVAGTTDSVTTQIIFTGVSLSLQASVTELRVNETAQIQAMVKDGSGNPIGGDTVRFSITGGSFSDGSQVRSIALDADGRATIGATSGIAGTAVVRAEALNSSDSISLVFTRNNLILTAAESSILAGGSDTVTVTATYVNPNGDPIANAQVSFTSTAGFITSESVSTDNSGVAETRLVSGAFAGVATVQATTSTTSAQIKVSFYSSNVAAISLAVTPDNIRTNGGAAKLIATVTDANGNMVSGADVNFRILRGPGGGETITLPMVTSQNGTAQSQIVAGSQPSMYRACEVMAWVGGIADTSKLTISGEPHIVTVSRPEDDTIKVPKAGQMDESTFEFFIGAVVQDVNGNPVADNTEVHFSALVSGLAVWRLSLVRWAGLGSASDEDKAIIDYRALDVPFEDVNNSLHMDPGIDLNIDGDPTRAARGDDVDGDGIVDYNPAIHDFFIDFNHNGICDVHVGEPWTIGDNGDTIYADLNGNGYRDTTELMIDHNGNDTCDLPASGDFPHWMWEMSPQWRGVRFDFSQNDFAVVIAASAVTVNGVAYARITYPRQFARRLIATVNAEASGIRDRDGERFILPVIREQ